MPARTDDDDLARWQLVEADSKRYARVKVIEAVDREIEDGVGEPGFELPATSAARA